MKSQTFPGTLEALAPIRKYLKLTAENHGFGKKASYNLQLAADELVTNIILYGYEKANRQGTVQLVTELKDQQLVVTIRDTAIPFDPHTKQLPNALDLTTPLEDRPIGGLGIFLIINSLDGFEYEYKGGENINILRLNLPDT
jgi:anti-sigma regulatory factor (Ser/Thr protein kinase)